MATTGAMTRRLLTLAVLILPATPAAAPAKPCAVRDCRFTITARPGTVTKHRTWQRFGQDDVVRFTLAVAGRALDGRSYGSDGCKLQYSGPGVLVRVNSCRPHIRVRATTLLSKPVDITAVYRFVGREHADPRLPADG